MKQGMSKTALSVLFGLGVIVSTGAMANPKPGEPGYGTRDMGLPAQQTMANPDLTEQSRGVKTLQDYIVQEKELFDFLFQNHPVFKYEDKGKLLGTYIISDRGSEYLHTGNSHKYSERKGRPMAVQYRLAEKSILDFPNKFVGPEKCGECHAAQYEKWSRSRHAKTIRFPGEHPEVDNNLDKTMYSTKDTSILPDGITPDAIYATVGTPRTKYGFIDSWLVRGSYHVRDGLLSDGTGTLVAGANQFSRGWAEWLTPEKAKEIQAVIPNFPTTIEEIGLSASHQWGMSSYGAKYEKEFVFQPASSYCEVCHTFKFDFQNKEEFFAALGNPEELRKHTISKGITCEECHGAGGHLEGGIGGGMPSNCERCHQRFNYIDELAETEEGKEKMEYAFNVKMKSSCPSCGTEGSQMFSSAHYDKGMRCSTCHDPHEVTGNDWQSGFTKPAIKQTCQDCHEAQTIIAENSKTHNQQDCVSCHMPNTGSCENFTGMQFPDMAGFDAVRRGHVWKIDVSPDRKMLNPGPGAKTRNASEKGWSLAKDEEGHYYLDLMWSCARTSPSDASVVENKGCHSPFQSELEDGLHYQDQMEIYGEVSKWQKPVKDGYQEIINGIERLDQLLEVTKLTTEQKSEVYMLIEKAQETADLLEADNSWGAHGPRYTKKRVEAGVAYINQAQAIVDGALAAN